MGGGTSRIKLEAEKRRATIAKAVRDSLKVPDAAEQLARAEPVRELGDMEARKVGPSERNEANAVELGQWLVQEVEITVRWSRWHLFEFGWSRLLTRCVCVCVRARAFCFVFSLVHLFRNQQ
jgi:hypothetical protein